MSALAALLRGVLQLFLHRFERAPRSTYCILCGTAGRKDLCPQCRRFIQVYPVLRHYARELRERGETHRASKREPPP